MSLLMFAKLTITAIYIVLASVFLFYIVAACIMLDLYAFKPDSKESKAVWRIGLTTIVTGAIAITCFDLFVW